VLTRITRIARVAASAVLACLALLPLATPSAQAATVPQTGWVRLAHLSPNTPAVDVYLYPFGNTTAQLVLKHVAYGTVSPYEPLDAGLYLVAMRAAGAGASTAPVISTNVTVAAGQAYTVAGLGPYSALTLKVLNDELGAPSGRAGIRVIEASLQAPDVTVTEGTENIATNLRFPGVTSYASVAAGSAEVRIATQTAAVTGQVTLAPGSTHTFAVLDGTGGAPKWLDLGDGAGDSSVPVGGVDTGFGGAAIPARGTVAGEAAWGALLLAGVVTALLAARRLRRG